MTTGTLRPSGDVDAAADASPAGAVPRKREREPKSAAERLSRELLSDEAIDELLAEAGDGRVRLTGEGGARSGAASARARTWIRDWNDNPRPFTWTKTAEEILERLVSYLQRIPGAGH